ncbi:hypothetical protein B0I35DRAFT_146224 [Stachybotrys elegans]|uniref:Secreted protein n=1 Tax=Stachybotrys elegans TaxID=80388 RepID=A0A8K0SE14_9HYPO|nr:hypothetical protein B0I35DRAFT_146224 [Stachybotrys elegans]
MPALFLNRPSLPSLSFFSFLSLLSPLLAYNPPLYAWREKMRRETIILGATKTRAGEVGRRKCPATTKRCIIKPPNTPGRLPALLASHHL